MIPRNQNKRCKTNIFIAVYMNVQEPSKKLTTFYICIDKKYLLWAQLYSNYKSSIGDNCFRRIANLRTEKVFIFSKCIYYTLEFDNSCKFSWSFFQIFGFLTTCTLFNYSFQQVSSYLTILCTSIRLRSSQHSWKETKLIWYIYFNLFSILFGPM